jgi:hypothetical protein
VNVAVTLGGPSDTSRDSLPHATRLTVNTTTNPVARDEDDQYSPVWQLTPEAESRRSETRRPPDRRMARNNGDDRNQDTADRNEQDRAK